MKALLLSGGEGTRLRPFSLNTPKPLLPVANIPLISYQFELLKRYSIREIVVGVGYKTEHFKKVVGSISKNMGIKAFLSIENTPLGTGGGLRNAYPFFKKEKEPFFVFNGDVIGDFNLDKILTFHKEKEAYATICIVKVIDPSSYGLIMTDTDMSVRKFIEKPKKEEIITDTINAGVYIFSPEIFSEISPDRPVSLEKEIFPSLLEQKKKICACVHYGYWMDVGTVEKYKKANFDVMDGKVKLFDVPLQSVDGNKLLVGGKSIIKEGIQIKGKVIMGNNCIIREGCLLEDSIIMDNVVVSENCIIKNSVIGTDVVIGNNCVIENMAIADKSLICPFTRSI